MRTLKGHVGAVRALAYAPGPQPLLATAGDDRNVRLWDVGTGELVEQMQGNDSLLSLAFSPDGKRLAAGGRSGSIFTFDVATRSRDQATARTFGPVVALSFSQDARALLGGVRTGGAGTGAQGVGRLTCWNLDPPHPLCQLDWAGDVESATFAPARDLFAIASHGRNVEFLEVGRRRREPAFRMPGRVRAMAFCPGDCRYLAVAGGKTVGVWD